MADESRPTAAVWRAKRGVRPGTKPRPVRPDRPNLDRMEGEGVEHHRALCLLALCRESSRSLRSIGRVVGRDPSLVSKWSRRFLWWERIANEPAPEQRAAALYRVLYLEEYGQADVEQLGDRIDVPLAGEDTPRDVTAAAEALLAKIGGVGPSIATDQKIESAQEKRREEAKKRNAGAINTVRLAIATAERALRATVDPAYRAENPHIKPITANVGDLRDLMRLLRELEQERAEIEDPSLAVGSAAAVDSIRVRIARETGGDVLAAARADALEVVAVIESIRAPNLTIDEVNREDLERDRIRA